jgi:peptidoglycan-associated lipoprotein
VLALAPGCSSRKKVSPQAQIEPPPTETTPAPSGENQPPPATHDENTGERLSLEDAFFDFDDFNLRTDAKSALETDGKYLQKNGDTKIIIEGHCDERGSVEYNLALGDRRAKAAFDYLVSLGVPAARLKTVSYGKEIPLCQDSNEECWSRNRRDHFSVTGKVE